jgi:diaminohydroxyphosphoribosylaminopyrimidine deaminase/5-amino-6-(5-phosphoribosylamino)uracil reductase
LRDGGVEVAVASGAEATAARRLNQPFRKHSRTGLPLVIFKIAMSLDGQTTTHPDDSPWISGSQSRELVHRWRSECDAIAVGIGTALTDDPLLTARIDGARQPKRVVFDSQARLPLDSQLMQTLDQAPVHVVTAPVAPAERTAALQEAGADVFVATDLESALRELGRREVTSLFLEGGRTLAAAFTSSDLVDESRTFVAAMLLGDSSAVPRAGGTGGEVPRAVQFVEHGASPPVTGPARRSSLDSTAKTIGDDILITARYKEW